MYLPKKIIRQKQNSTKKRKQQICFILVILVCRKIRKSVFISVLPKRFGFSQVFVNKVNICSFPFLLPYVLFFPLSLLLTDFSFKIYYHFVRLNKEKNCINFFFFKKKMYISLVVCFLQATFCFPYENEHRQSGFL